MISALGVFVGTVALVIILSVFNGFEGLILKMFNTMSPTLVISPAKGKTFQPDEAYFHELKRRPEVLSFTEVLAENALIWYKEKQTPALVKGVSEEYLKNPKLDSIMVEGHFILSNQAGPTAVAGSALQALLDINPSDPFEQLHLYSPKKGKQTINALNPFDSFHLESVSPAGIFELQQEVDQTLIIPLSLARKLFGEETKISSIEIFTHTEQQGKKLMAEIQEKLGADFLVRDRIAQNQALYQVLSSEKWMVYIILTFVLVIAIFNVIGSLTMLVIEKLKDISILNSLGAGKKLIKRIFLLEGMMITLSGCIFGLIIGLLFCVFQQTYGWIKMGESTLLQTNAYPVALKGGDFLLIFLTVSFFSLCASALAANLSVKNIHTLNKDL